MALRCLLFSSDQGTAAPILEVLSGLGVEGEHCPEAVSTVERVTQESFQIVIIDWDQQPEAGLLLHAARERKATDRPLTLAIVSDDASVPQALQAGANSILRKPLIVNQVRDTLTTARDLLRAKENAAQAAANATANSVTTLPANAATGERTLRAGEFLQSSGTTPGGQIETESNIPGSFEVASTDPVDPLKELEPMAASVGASAAPVAEARIPPSYPEDDEPRGLEWYKRNRSRGGEAAAPAPARTTGPSNPELLGYDQSPHSSSPASTPEPSAPPAAASEQSSRKEAKRETGVFSSYEEPGEGEPSSGRGFPKRKAIMAAVALAACAVIAAPQAPWHKRLLGLVGLGKQDVHSWLNPTPVTPTQAPASHESFGRAGDEYKLPVAENIPDATTDPSQIRVVPVVDPTVRKPNIQGSNADQPAGQGDAANTDPTDQPQPTGVQAAPVTPDAVQPGSVQPVNGSPADAPAVAVPNSAPPASTTSNPPATHSDPPAAVQPPARPAVQPAAHQNPPVPYTAPTTKVPSSLQSTMASMTPAAGGNKAPEAAMPSIEPVAVTEAAERALLTDQPALDYPASARGMQGTVILQVLIGRDGTVQDAKFLQGSLAFAHAAIDGVKKWKFKPYNMNGRPVSVATTLTINFKP